MTGPDDRRRPERAELLGYLLAAAWVYASTQHDLWLAKGVAIAALLAFARGRPREGRLTMTWSWLAGAAACLALGAVWRQELGPPPPVASSSSALVDALQAGSLLAGLGLFALGAVAGPRGEAVRLLSWLAVAASSNVPASAAFWPALAGFTLVNLVGLWRRWWARRPDGRRMPRGSGFYLGMSLAGGLTIGSVVALLWLIGLTDRWLMEMVQGLRQPRFGRHGPISSPAYLRLGGPGPSGLDPQPVLEIDAGESSVVYLRMQVFDHFERSGWTAVSPGPRYALEQTGAPGLDVRRLSLYLPTGSILPSPVGVVGCSVPAVGDVYGLVHAPEPEELTQVSLVLDPTRRPAPPLDSERGALLSVPENLAALLAEQLAARVPAGLPPAEAARRLERHFQAEYGYTLRVPAVPAAEMVRRILVERRAAYCTYFATTLTLLLRQRGIPARVVTGFVAQERIGTRRLARVRDAHAWVEAWLPGADGESRWVELDPTPAADRLTELGPGGGVMWQLFDRVRRASLRLRVLIVAMSWTERLTWLAGLLGAGGLIALLWVGWRQRRAARPGRQTAGDRTAPHALRPLYLRFEALAVERLGPRPASETDRELLRRLTVLGPQAETAARAFIRGYQAARYGAVTDVELEPLLADVRAALPADAPARE